MEFKALILERKARKISLCSNQYIFCCVFPKTICKTVTEDGRRCVCVWGGGRLLR